MTTPQKKQTTKIVLTLTAILFGVMGIGLSFLPEETTVFFEGQATPTFVLSLQLLGSFYLGMGMFNWMSRHSIVGGIYNKPLVIANVLHFGVSAVALLKTIGLYTGSTYTVLLGLTVLYSLFALYYVLLLLGKL